MAKAKDYTTTLYRLALILQKLYSGEELSVKELADELEVSSRTIQRYFNDYLLPAGFPIERSGRRWRLKQRFPIDEEIEIALQTLDEIAKEIGEGFYQKVKPILSKLLTLENGILYTHVEMEDISDKFEEVLKLERAIKEKRYIHCLYKSTSQKEYRLAPLKIVNFDGYWYLIAKEKEIFKKFYLKNLHSVKLLRQRFTPTPLLQEKLQNAINIWFDPQNKAFEVVLFADNIAAKHLKRRPINKTQFISGEDSDGSCEVRLRITHEMEIIPTIQSWLPHIRVLEPEWLNERIKENVKAYLSNI